MTLRKDPIKVLLAEAPLADGEVLPRLLTGETSVTVVGQARDGKEIFHLAKKLRPDVVLLDLDLPLLDGLQITRRLRAEPTLASCRVILLTRFADDKQLVEARQAGAIVYLLPDVLKADLLLAIRAAVTGKSAPTYPLPLADPVPSGETLLNSLTDREREVLILLAQGNSNKEIANRLSLSNGTVRGYVSAVLTKLSVSDRTQATLMAIKYGLIH